MADDKLNAGENPEEQNEDAQDSGQGESEEEETGGLGNLPPLSDFESASTDSDSGDESFGGLPPLGDISLETPTPTGGNVKPPPAGFGGDEAFETPISDTGISDSGIETPDQPLGTGFQDLAADSDFSPETPEIGTGPESDLETPMFDTAFGGGDDDTSAPTQAMETPMFGEEDTGGEVGFDEGAFGVAPDNAVDDDFGAGTPIPDFSPDTGMTAGQQPPPPPQKAAKPAGGGMGKVLAVGIILLLLGLLVGPFLAPYLGFMPYPQAKTIDELSQEIDQKDRMIASLRQTQVPTDAPDFTPEQIDELIKQRDNINAEIGRLKAELETLTAQANTRADELAQLEEAYELKREEYAEAERALDYARGQVAIQNARNDALVAQNERLEALNGKLDEANARRVATRDSLLHELDRLEILVREGIPLTPDKYSRAERLAAINDLKARVEASNWVSPALLDEYSTLYEKEIRIGETREYFFAKIPVTDRFGSQYQKWAECVMNGNWSVYFRTLDGMQVGIYEQADTGTGYVFRQDFPEGAEMHIAQMVMAERPDDWMQKAEILTQTQVVAEEKSRFQKVFDSL